MLSSLAFLSAVVDACCLRVVVEVVHGRGGVSRKEHSGVIEIGCGICAASLRVTSAIAAFNIVRYYIIRGKAHDKASANHAQTSTVYGSDLRACNTLIMETTMVFSTLSLTGENIPEAITLSRPDDFPCRQFDFHRSAYRPDWKQSTRSQDGRLSLIIERIACGRSAVVYSAEIVTTSEKGNIPSSPHPHEQQLCVKIARPNRCRTLAREAWIYDQLTLGQLQGVIAPMEARPRSATTLTLEMTIRMRLHKRTGIRAMLDDLSDMYLKHCDLRPNNLVRAPTGTKPYLIDFAHFRRQQWGRGREAASHTQVAARMLSRRVFLVWLLPLSYYPNWCDRSVNIARPIFALLLMCLGVLQPWRR
ncbi:uncharacterized protein B0H18DRAFT_1197957 [Fomitopsis serialis]|uniref:uncharacterized protein n=1 Tax=Fomitopsis serialis TaxID=139415 RepID=UPI0020088EAD|nr:uncharacterized protein B0H18DRAFT_1197957 [Neoantrodia serialis]KAH9918956.1 hypothetical protein B0H18DRAFT_1197957 [Neoantrodia serialis]